jgi:hypothetical protein
MTRFFALQKASTSRKTDKSVSEVDRPGATVWYDQKQNGL